MRHRAAARGGRTRERWSSAFDSTDDADESTVATIIDATDVVANPLLKRNALRRGRDPDARDNRDDKDEEDPQKAPIGQPYTKVPPHILWFLKHFL